MEVKPGYKMTEVGVIPEEWEAAQVSEVVRNVASGISRNRTSTGAFPFWGSTGLIGQTDSADYSGPAILVARVGANAGFIYQVAGEYSVSDNTLVVQPRESTNITFLRAALSYEDPRKLIFGSGQPLVTGGQLKSMVIPFPTDPTEQRAIATVLSDMDALIEGLDKLIAKKRDIKQGAMQELLTGKRRLPGFTGEWEYSPLEGCVEQLISGGTPSTKIHEFWSGTIPWITGADFEYQKIGSIRRHISSQAVLVSSTNLVESGELLIVTRTGVGKIAIAPFTVAISQDITGVVLRRKKMTPEFLYWYIDHKKSDVQQLNQGTSINGITKDKLIEFIVPMPDVDEQSAIAEVLSSMDKEITALEARRDKCKAMKQGMMQELLTGKMRMVNGKW